MTQNPTNTASDVPKFGKLRSLLFPIHNYELKKILPLLFIFFCISFIYTILRDLKDTLVVTAPGAGAEVIPFLKLWCVVPGAVILMLIFAKLSNLMSREKLFYVTITPFLVFFLFFALFLYPNAQSIHPYESAQLLEEWLPKSAAFKGIVGIYRNWMFALFYVMAELWGSMVITNLFWGFANDISKVTEAKRFYGLLGIGANLALIVSGRVIRWAASGQGGDFADSLVYLMAFVSIAGLGVFLAYYWMNKVVLTDKKYFDPEQKKKRLEKPKLNLIESIKYLTRSKYLACIAVMVCAYGISINLIEVTWKSQLKLQYPDPVSYQYFMGYFSEITGFVTLFMFLFVSHNVIRRLGWQFAAMVTPVVIFATGCVFLNFIVFRDFFMGFLATLGTTPLMLAVVFGSAQNIMSKSSKYSLFDPTKEMAYIPLDVESKVKGKVAIDMVAPSLGKSGGSVIQQVLMLFFPTVAGIAPYIGGIFLGIIAVWLLTIRVLGSQFKKYEAKKVEEQDLETKTETANPAQPVFVTR